MKRMLIVLCALITILAPIPAAARPIDFTGITTTLMSVDFVDSNHGWAVGAAGAIYATTNGGKHWKLQDWDYSGEPSTILRSVKFVDRQNGWATGRIENPTGAGLETVIIHTHNGGKSWEIQAAYPAFGDMGGIDFLDKDNGWTSGVWLNNGQGREIIFRTTDGGATWTYQTLSTHSEQIFDVDFSDSSNGWGSGGEGNIWHTADGGVNWQLQNNPLFTNYSGGPTIYGVCALDNLNVWAAAGSGQIIRTIDGGNDWNIQYSESGAGLLTAIDFFDQQNGWAVGPSNILHTADGGADWQTQSSEADDLRDVEFVSSSEGWAVGSILVPDPNEPGSNTSKAAIIHTSDGGTNWKVQFLDDK